MKPWSMYLNSENDSRHEQSINYSRALRYLALALDIFDDEKCDENTCDSDLVLSALSIYGQAADVNLELVEYFYTNRPDKRETALYYAKEFIDRGTSFTESYQVGPEAQSFFKTMPKRYERLNQQHEEEQRQSVWPSEEETLQSSEEE